MNPPSRPAVRPTRRRSLRAQLSIGLAAAMLLPVVVMYLWANAFVLRLRRQMQHDLYDVTLAASRVVDAHLLQHLRAVRALAVQLSGRRLETATAAEMVAATRAIYPGFFAMLAVGADGRLLVLSQPSDSLAAAAYVGMDVSDRAYFRVPMATGALHVTDVYRGRGPARAAVVTIGAPVTDAAGRRAGVVAGGLDLAAFAHLERDYAFVAPAARIVVTDQHGHVVYGGRDRRFATLEDIAATSLARLGASEGPVYEWRDSTAAGVTENLVGHATGEQGWHVYVALPTAVIWREVRLFRLGLVTAVALAFGVLGIALWLLTRQAIRPLDQLVGALRQFSGVGPRRDLPLPRDAPAEIAELVDSFEAMSHRVGSVLSGILPICASCKRIRNQAGAWEGVEAYVRDRTEAEFSHTVCPDCHARLYPEGTV